MTKKELQNLAQMQENDIIRNAITDYNNYIETISSFDSVKRLRSCTATVYTTPRYYSLQSYNTMIAFINRETGEAFDVLRFVYGYTSTSAQHIAKFFADYGAKYRYRFYSTY